MSDSFLKDYKDYYRVRAERYADNPNYKHSYEAEKKLSDAMQSCNELIEFKDKIGDLNERCANALIKDKYLIRKAFYEKTQEIIRLKAVDRILDKVNSIATALDLATMVTEEENKGSIEISMDQSNREFHSSWSQLDEIEIYQNAEVPGQYKADMQNTVEDAKQAIVDKIASEEENNQAWQAGWRITPDVIHEHRHRRLLPYKDEHVSEQLIKFKSIINR